MTKSIFASIEDLASTPTLTTKNYQYRLVVMVPNKQPKRKDFGKVPSGVLLTGHCRSKGNTNNSETLTLVKNTLGMSVFYSGHNEYVERLTKKGEWVGREFGPMAEISIQKMMEDEGVEGEVPTPARYINNPDFTPSGKEPRLILDPELKDELVIDTKYYANPVGTYVNGVEMSIRPTNTVVGKHYDEGQLRRVEIYFNTIEADPKRQQYTRIVNGEEVTTYSLRIDLASPVINLVYEEAETIDAEILDAASRRSRVISEKEVKQRKAKANSAFWTSATRKGSESIQFTRKAKAEEKKPATTDEQMDTIIPGV